MTRPPETLETSRLHLRPPRLSDAERIFTAYAQDPMVTRYLTWRPHQSIEDTRQFLRFCEEEWQTDSSFPWVILRKQDGELLGMVHIFISGHKAELGYVLARPYWGRGIMTEAVQVVVDWALAHPQIYRVWAVCDVENVASARVMEKVGMEREGILRRWLKHPKSESPRDCYCYSMIK
jgi:RimJ/RimL family protein N-acetyltransferase